MTEAQAIYRTQSGDTSIKGFRCPNCKNVIAETNGTSLRIGWCAFPFTVTFSCLYCGSMVKWRPVNGNGNGCNKHD